MRQRSRAGGLTDFLISDGRGVSLCPTPRCSAEQGEPENTEPRESRSDCAAYVARVSRPSEGDVVVTTRTAVSTAQNGRPNPPAYRAGTPTGVVVPCRRQVPAGQVHNAGGAVTVRPAVTGR